MGDFARKLATKPKRSRRNFDPAPDRILGRHRIKCRVDLHRRQIPRVKFEPFRFRQIGWVKASSPFLKTPGASAEANFLLIVQVQIQRKCKLNRRAGEVVDLVLRRTGWFRGEQVCRREIDHISGSSRNLTQRLTQLPCQSR